MMASLASQVLPYFSTGLTSAVLSLSPEASSKSLSNAEEKDNECKFIQVKIVRLLKKDSCCVGPTLRICVETSIIIIAVLILIAIFALVLIPVAINAFSELLSSLVDTWVMVFMCTILLTYTSDGLEAWWNAVIRLIDTNGSRWRWFCPFDSFTSVQCCRFLRKQETYI